MTGEGIASVLTSLATLVGVVGGIWVQLRGQTEAREGRAAISEKVDVTAAKVDENTALTKDTAAKVENTASKVDEVHAVQVATSGTFPTIKMPDP